MGMDRKIIETNVCHIGDPFVLVEGDKLYMYATSSADGFKVFESDGDLSVWKEIGLCYHKRTSFGYMDFWACEVVKRQDGRFVMHFTAKDRRDDKLKIGVAVADSPLGEFRDVYPMRPMFDFNYSVIDATVYEHYDGKFFLYFVRDCSDNIVEGRHTSEIYGARLTEDLTSLASHPVRLLTPDAPWETRGDWRWNEAPAAVHDGENVYLCYSVNCFDSRDYSVGYAVSKDPLGGFVKAEQNPVLRYVDGKISGPGHNCFFRFRDKLYTAYHVHTNYDKPSGDRRACISEATVQNGVLKIRYR